MRFIAGRVIAATTLSPEGAPIAAMSLPAPLIEDFILAAPPESRIDGAQIGGGCPFAGGMKLSRDCCQRLALSYWAS